MCAHILAADSQQAKMLHSRGVFGCNLIDLVYNQDMNRGYTAQTNI